MITFHPYADFTQTAKVLDRQRLGSQRREALHILKASLGLVTPYKAYSAMRQWRGYHKALCSYGIIICLEWQRRGYKDTQEMLFRYLDYKELRFDQLEYSPWVGYEPYHSNQRARLLDKNYEWYSQFGWTEEPSSTYYFPEHLYLKG